MWQASEGFVLIIFVILVFGLLSLPLPLRPKKGRPFRETAGITNEAMARPMQNASKSSLQQAASGKLPNTFQDAANATPPMSVVDAAEGKKSK